MSDIRYIASSFSQQRCGLGRITPCIMGIRSSLDSTCVYLSCLPVATFSSFSSPWCVALRLPHLVSKLYQISLHYTLSVFFHDYGRVSSLSHLAQRLGLEQTIGNLSQVTTTNPSHTPYSNLTEFGARANATFVFLCRNNDLAGVVSSIRQMEDRFNRHYKYPWVLLNEEPFTDDFKQ